MLCFFNEYQPRMYFAIRVELNFGYFLGFFFMSEKSETIRKSTFQVFLHVRKTRDLVQVFLPSVEKCRSKINKSLVSYYICKKNDTLL